MKARPPRDPAIPVSSSPPGTDRRPSPLPRRGLRGRLPSPGPRAWWSAFAGWNLLLFALSSFSAPAGAGPPVPHLDKAAHFVFFAAGAFVFATALAAGPGRSPGPAVLTLVVLTAIGALDEFHQSFTPGRSGNDLGDLAADAAGALAGWWLACRFAGRRETAPAAAGSRAR